MTLWLQVIDGVVKQCVDKEQVGDDWRPAIEVRPELIPGREQYTAHHFDLSKDPAQVVWGVREVPVEDHAMFRRERLRQAFQILLNQQSSDEVLFHAQDVLADKLARIDECTTHDELAAIELNLAGTMRRFPVRVTKMDFSRLFTLSERAAQQAARKHIASMTPTEYASLENLGYVYLDVMFQNFDLPTEYIELNHPDTIYAIETVMVNAGLLTAERAAQIIANQPPA